MFPKPRPFTAKLALTLSMLCLFVFIVLALAVHNETALTDYDATLAESLAGRLSESGEDFYTVVSVLGSEVLFLIALAAAGYFIYKRWWLELAFGLSTVGIGRVINALLKLGFARERPGGVSGFTYFDEYSFPSGHAMMSTLVYGTLVYILLRKVRGRGKHRLLLGGMGILIIFIGLSRVMLELHFFSDVMAGYAAGGCWLGFNMAIMEWVLIRRQRANADDTALSPAR